MPLKQFTDSLTDDNLSAEDCVAILKDLIKLGELEPNDFAHYEKKVKAEKKKIRSKVVEAITEEQKKDLANKKYGFYNADLDYVPKFVKNPISDKMEWTINIRGTNTDIAIGVDIVSPGISQSIVHQAPFLKDHTTRIEPRQAIEIRSGVEKLFHAKISMQEINEAIANNSNINEFNPITEWLDSLTNDPALENLDVMNNWMQLCFGADDLPVIKKIGRRWILQAVGRGTSPGRYNECVLCLMAEDGAEGKTQCIMSLGPDPSYSYEGCPDMDNTRSSAQELIGSWFVDFSEGENQDKHSQETNKRFITTSFDKYVEKFQNFNKIVKRPYVFLMTTNNGTPLNSTELSVIRRLQVVKVKKFDYKTFLKIKKQLWYEAFQEMKKLDAQMQVGDKEPYVLKDEDVEELREYSHQFVHASILREQLINYFTGLKIIDPYYTVDEITDMCKKWNKYATAQQIRHIMCDDLKFIKSKKNIKIVIGGQESIITGRWVYLTPQFALSDASHATLSKDMKVEDNGWSVANDFQEDTVQQTKLAKAFEAFQQTDEYKKIMEAV
jgi:hypothetical protein